MINPIDPIITLNDLNDRQSIAKLIESNAAKKVSYYASLIRGMVVMKENGNTLVDTGLCSETFNCVIASHFSEQKAHFEVTHMIDHFVRKQLPMAWWVSENCSPENLGEILLKAGLKFEETDAGMAALLKDIPQPEPLPKGFEIHAVNNAREMESFANVLDTLFEPKDPEVKKYYHHVGSLDMRKEHPMHLFVGHFRGQPACCSALFLGSGVAGVYDIGTKPEARRKGYGTIMTLHALNFAREQGYHVATLQASEKGIGIYKKLGFQEICKFFVYSNKNLLHRKKF